MQKRVRRLFFWDSHHLWYLTTDGRDRNTEFLIADSISHIVSPSVAAGSGSASVYMDGGEWGLDGPIKILAPAFKMSRSKLEYVVPSGRRGLFESFEVVIAM